MQTFRTACLFVSVTCLDLRRGLTSSKIISSSSNGKDANIELALWLTYCCRRSSFHETDIRRFLRARCWDICKPAVQSGLTISAYGRGQIAIVLYNAPGNHSL